MFDDPLETREQPPGRYGALLKRAGLSGASPAALAGIGVLLLVALAFTGWRVGTLLYSEDSSEVVFEAGPGDEGEAPGEASVLDGVEEPSDSGSGESATIWVHVAGAVRAPGLCEMEPGARVGAAIDAAGGPGDDAALDAVNLARVLADGEQVYVPSRSEVEAGLAGGAAAGPGGAGSQSAGSAGAGVDINSASEAELVALPGVGPATAAKIVQDREANGPFGAPEEIMRVSGIGDKKFEALRDLITVR